MRGLMSFSVTLCATLLLSVAPAAASPTTLNPATKVGAREAVAHYAERLLRPPFEADARARATCGRYLETAARTLKVEPALPCALRSRLLETQAMCAWLSGDEPALEEHAAALVTQRCSGRESGLDGLIGLTKRWWRPEVAQAYIAAQRTEARGRKERVAALEEIATYVGQVKDALGKDYPRRSGGLLVLKVPRGAGAARAGLRRGDVIISIAARPVRGMSDVRRHLSGAKRATSSVLFYRDGQRIEGSWPGKSKLMLQGAPLPERLP